MNSCIYIAQSNQRYICTSAMLVQCEILSSQRYRQFTFNVMYHILYITVYMNSCLHESLDSAQKEQSKHISHGPRRRQTGFRVI